MKTDIFYMERVNSYVYSLFLWWLYALRQWCIFISYCTCDVLYLMYSLCQNFTGWQNQYHQEFIYYCGILVPSCSCCCNLKILWSVSMNV